MEEIGETCYVEMVGPGYDRVPFVLDAGKDVRLYELLVVRDGRREYYGRVVAGEERSEDATPERLRKQKAMFYDAGPRRDDDFTLVRTQHLEILGQLVRGDDGAIEVVEPDFLPEVKARVIRPDDADLARLAGMPAEGYRLGWALVGRELEFVLDVRAPSRHLGIFGRPGTGKSYLAGALSEEFVDRGIPIISFDVNGEMEEAVEELGGINLTPGKDIRVPIRFLDSHEFLAAAPHMTRDQEAVVLDAFVDLRDDPQASDTFEIDDLSDRIQAIGTQLGGGQAGVGARAAQKIQRLHTDYILGDRRADGTPIRVPVRTPADWEALFRERPCINLFLGRLSGRRRETVVAAVCRLLQRLRQQDQIPPFVLMLDEAHFFVPSGNRSSSTDVVRDFVRVGRHGPMGTVLISQSPSGIDRQILLLVNTVFAFALTGDDVRAVGDFLADAPPELVGRIPLLRAGTAVVGAAKDTLRHALLVRIRQRRTKHTAQTVDLAEEARRWREERGGRPA
jgi:DNA helicase HerA-like ATPase